MPSRLIEIAQGWYNLRNASPAVREQGIKRLSICAECPHQLALNQLTGTVISLLSSSERVPVLYKCGICGCALSAKVLSPDSVCPQNKW